MPDKTGLGGQYEIRLGGPDKTGLDGHYGTGLRGYIGL